MKVSPCRWKIRSSTGSDRPILRIDKCCILLCQSLTTHMRKLLLLLLLPLQMMAQPNPFLAFKKYPFPSGLTSAPSGRRIAWAMDEEGRRNVYVAEGPAFAPRKLTDFTNDDGQEITSLSITADGKYVVFVRGADHGANWE